MEKSIKSVENTIVVQVTFFLHNLWHYHIMHIITRQLELEPKQKLATSEEI